MVKLTETRRKKAILLLQKAHKQAHKVRRVPVCSLAKLIGVLNAARIQFPRVSFFMIKLNKLKTRAVKSHGWNGFARMNPSVQCQLQTWTQWIKSNHPNSLKKLPLPQAIITTDAAPTGWGSNTIINFFYPDASGNYEKVQSLDANNVTSFQQKAGNCCYPQSFGLEGPNLDPSLKTLEREKSSSWESGRYIRKRLINEEKGPVFTSRKHGHVSPEEQAFNDADCVCILLERDWILDDLIMIKA
jgi:hypothetical protein